MYIAAQNTWLELSCFRQSVLIGWLYKHIWSFYKVGSLIDCAHREWKFLLKTEALGSRIQLLQVKFPTRSFFFSLRFCMGVGFMVLTPQNIYKVVDLSKFLLHASKSFLKESSTYSLPLAIFYHSKIREILSSFSSKDFETYCWSFYPEWRSSRWIGCLGKLVGFFFFSFT